MSNAEANGSPAGEPPIAIQTPRGPEATFSFEGLDTSAPADSWADSLTDVSAGDPPEDLVLREVAALEAEGGVDFSVSESVLVDEKGTDGTFAYLRAIGQIALLTPEQEVDLAKRIEAGALARQALSDTVLRGALRKRYKPRDLREIVIEGERARQDFINANLRLVVWLAKQHMVHRSHRQQLLDVIQEGNFGLMRAVDKFDYTKGFKFSTYATWWIRRSMEEYRAEGFLCTVSVYLSDRIVAYDRAVRNLTSTYGREPTLQEVANHLDVSLPVAANLKRVREDRYISIDAPLQDGDPNSETIGTHLPDPTPSPEKACLESIMGRFDDQWISTILEELDAMGTTARRRGKTLHSLGYIARHYFGIGAQKRSSRELAEECGATEQSVRNWRNHAVEYFRQKAKAQGWTV